MNKMVGQEVRRIRCEETLKVFQSSRMCFLTLTTSDVVDIFAMRKRWRSLRHFLAEKYKKSRYIMNYEIHPKGHGWHIHSVWNCYINLRGDNIYKLRSFGFGSINVKKVNSLGVADYLAKHCLKAYRGIQNDMRLNGRRLRLVNTSRGLPKLDDYKWVSALNDKVKKIMDGDGFNKRFSSFSFQERWRVAELSVIFDCDPSRFLGLLIQAREKRSAHNIIITNRALRQFAIDKKTPIFGV